ncbi:Oidioi.mRNA.OKI2018_I69.chr1.g1355.t1.cds [Oikopleura dioica]|uniref:Oidioi.mRNA.OKI2018_I69.chr1.g1355.t1.cds n=1 Tax=Oikopleura dioica TaxID=34765 RepID=A0ABN7SRW9_OIKDI|nr:Oidioi.mRNA.OKI2018_I69.chr1.g1355.t1.cds [Oikopleura dioica]
MVEVYRLVQRFDQRPEGLKFLPPPDQGKLEEAESSAANKFTLDCDVELRGLVKKVVQFFNEFADRNIQSKKKQNVKERRRNKTRLKQKLVKNAEKKSSSAKEEAALVPAIREEVKPKPVYTSPEQYLRDSIRLRIPEHQLLRHVTHQSEWYFRQRNELRAQIPGEAIYAKRDFFQQLPDHLVVNIFKELPRSDLANLKLVCRDFDWLIHAYDVLPFDSGWRPGRKYREDRCEKCKRVRQRGDTSICRFHSKMFYGDPCSGPQNFYLCCHKTDKNAPGCVRHEKHDNWYLNNRNDP